MYVVRIRTNLQNLEITNEKKIRKSQLVITEVKGKLTTCYHFDVTVSEKKKLRVKTRNFNFSYGKRKAKNEEKK